MGIGWEPIRLAEWNDPERARFSRDPEEAVESRVATSAHGGSLAAAERSLEHEWTEEVSRDKFVAALRALADALSQDQNFTFTVDHRFMIMRPVGTPSIRYHERENQEKTIDLRFSWEA